MSVLRSSLVRAGMRGPLFALVIAAAGCGDSRETGTLVEKTPGQDAGEKASQDHMRAMMKGQQGKSR